MRAKWEMKNDNHNQNELQAVGIVDFHSIRIFFL